MAEVLDDECNCCAEGSCCEHCWHTFGVPEKFKINVTGFGITCADLNGEWILTKDESDPLQRCVWKGPLIGNTSLRWTLEYNETDPVNVAGFRLRVGGICYIGCPGQQVNNCTKVNWEFKAYDSFPTGSCGNVFNTCAGIYPSVIHVNVEAQGTAGCGICCTSGIPYERPVQVEFSEGTGKLICLDGKMFSMNFVGKFFENGLPNCFEPFYENQGPIPVGDCSGFADQEIINANMFCLEDPGHVPNFSVLFNIGAFGQFSTVSYRQFSTCNTWEKLLLNCNPFHLKIRMCADGHLSPGTIVADITG